MEKLEEASKLISGLVKRGFSKYRISKCSGVSWRTISDLQKGLGNPRVETIDRIKSFSENADARYAK